MKTKIILLVILMLTAINNFAQSISSISSAIAHVDSLSQNDSAIIIEQRQILYTQMLKDEPGYILSKTEKNFMHSPNHQWTIDTDFVVTKRHSVWKSAGIGMVTGLVIGAILGAVTANPDDLIFGYTAAEGALGFGAFGAAFGGVSGLIVGVIQNTTSKKHQRIQ